MPQNATYFTPPHLIPIAPFHPTNSPNDKFSNSRPRSSSIPSQPIHNLAPEPPLSFNHPQSKDKPPPAPPFQNNVPDPLHFSPTLLTHFTPAPSITHIKHPPLTPSCSPKDCEFCPQPETHHQAPRPYLGVTSRELSLSAILNAEIRQATLKLLPQSYAAEEMATAAEIPPEPPPYPMNNSRRVFLKTG